MYCINLEHFWLPRNHSFANGGVYIYRSRVFCNMAHKQICYILLLILARRGENLQNLH